MCRAFLTKGFRTQLVDTVFLHELTLIKKCWREGGKGVDACGVEIATRETLAWCLWQDVLEIEEEIDEGSVPGKFDGEPRRGTGGELQWVVYLIDTSGGLVRAA